MNTLIYVDKELAIAIATKLVGLVMSQTKDVKKGASLSWLIQANLSVGDSEGISKDIRAMLPEDIVYLFYDKIVHRHTSVPDAIKALSESSSDKKVMPGTVVSLSGVLNFPGLENLSYDPFSPPNIDVPAFSVHGERCFVGQLTGEGFVLPVYFLENAKDQVCFCNSEPVEIIGVARWSPPYRPRGANPLNKVIRVGAALLR